MAYYARRRARRRNRIVLFSFVGLAIVGGGGWWWFGGDDQTDPSPEDADPIVARSDIPDNGPAPQNADDSPLPPPRHEPQPVEQAELVANEEVLIPAESPEDAAEPDRSDAVLVSESTEPEPPDEPDSTAARAHDDTRSGNASIEAARKLHAAGKRIEARHRLNALLERPLPPVEAHEVRTLLKRIADETLFSRKAIPDDPLVDTYVVQSGDVLINIGKKYAVPYEVLMDINNIQRATAIRVGQKLKVLRGPFHVRIDKSDFRLDVYLRDLYVRSYRVGLGSDNGTPEGKWRVKERLTNPTYYPPASAGEKRIIQPDDPTNPLGEHWIGLEGISGNAVGQGGYGIHGTIEPESIGKAVSLGCVRMHNEDVGQLYRLLLPGQSTVTIQP